MGGKIEIAPMRCGILYFESLELVMMLISTFVALVPAWLLILFNLYLELLGYVVVAGIFISAFLVNPFRRAKFIRSGGVYLLNHEEVEWVWKEGKRQRYSIHDMKYKIQDKGNRVDVLFGRSFLDFFKYYGSKEAQGVGLYSIDRSQLEEVIKSLGQSY